MILSELIYRAARTNDLPALITMLADDALGAQRENSTLPPSKD